MEPQYFRGTFFDTGAGQSAEVDFSFSENHITFYDKQRNLRQLSVSDISAIQKPSTDAMVIYFGWEKKQAISLFLKESIQAFTLTYQNNAEIRRMLKQKSSRAGCYTLLVLFALFAGFLLFTWFVIVPWAVGKAAEKFPVAYENKLGEKMMESLKPGLDIDTAGSRELTLFFNQLHYASEGKVKVWLSDKSDVNAFAVPGGHIVVYKGMIKKLNRYEQLAALMAHEYAHIYHKHTLRNLFSRLSGWVLITMVFGNEGTALTGTLINQAAELHNLRYSRELETEADFTGLALMQHSHIDQGGMLELLTCLKNEPGSEIPAFISTHPLPRERMDALKGSVSKVKSQPGNSEQLKSSWHIVKVRCK